MTNVREWRTYPFDLVPSDPAFSFPAAEGVHPGFESDTWFIAGDLIADDSQRRFAFLTIFNKNRPGGSIVADFHTMALCDLDNGTYGTFTDYDMPPKNMAPDSVPKLHSAAGHLDMTYDGSAGTAVWKTRRDADEQLIPYTYEVVLFGIDQAGEAMELRLDVTPTKAPVPVGASVYNGRFECFGQPETFSYFQTGMSMTGSLRWGDVDEQVSGRSGHVDRQWFPLYAGGGGTDGDQRALSHEWRTIHLDNGVDIVGWRQFDRRDRNSLRPFTGATVTYEGSDSAPDCVEDIEVQTTSHVRWPESVRSLIRPPAAGRYMPDVHRLTSQTLDLDLTGEPLVPAPAHGLPIEYMEGPFLYRGSMNGQPVTGFGISERSIALYRDWELVEVLATAVENVIPRPDELHALIATLGALVDDERTHEAADCLETAVRPAIGALPEGADGLPVIVDDLAIALSPT